MFLGETCGFPRGRQPVYGVPMRCGNGSRSISLSHALLLAGIPRLTQSAARRKMQGSPCGDSRSLEKKQVWLRWVIGRQAENSEESLHARRRNSSACNIPYLLLHQGAETSPA